MIVMYSKPLSYYLLNCIRVYDNRQSSDIFQLILAFDRQAKFDWTNFLYIINGEINKFIIGKQVSRQFLALIISIAVHILM